MSFSTSLDTPVIRVPGKAILAGEHAAVRGMSAVVAPLFSLNLELSWAPAPEFSVAAGPLREPFELAFKKAAEILGRKLPALHFAVTSEIPPRAGLGSSAALSVAIARFFLPAGERDPLFALALQLEDLFHGKSSGMDVAAVLSPGPILFSRGITPCALPEWRPHLHLTDTHLRSSTKACVAQVEALRRPDLDLEMQAAVSEIREAFAEESLARLAGGMNRAEKCFAAWGLIPESVAGQIAELKNRGALAVKPTGSGQGGYLLSLWEKPQAALSLWG